MQKCHFVIGHHAHTITTTIEILFTNSKSTIEWGRSAIERRMKRTSSIEVQIPRKVKENMNIYLFSKVVCFVCLSPWELPKPWWPHCALGIIQKHLMSRGALRVILYCLDMWTYGAWVIEYWTIFLKRNHNSKFYRNWGFLSGLLLKSAQWVGFYGSNCVFFRPNVQEILNFEQSLLFKKIQ
jgi:hypothetical protein